MAGCRQFQPRLRRWLRLAFATSPKREIEDCGRRSACPMSYGEFPGDAGGGHCFHGGQVHDICLCRAYRLARVAGTCNPVAEVSTGQRCRVVTGGSTLFEEALVPD